MRCRLTALCALLLCISFSPLTLSAQTRQDALRVFQTLQARCEAGVNFDQYVLALDEAQTELDAFFNSTESEKNPEFSEKIERALIAHQSAFAIWKSKVAYKQDLVSSDHPTIQLMLQVYPEAEPLFGRNGQAFVSTLVSFLWDQADSRISEAKKMVSRKSKR